MMAINQCLDIQSTRNKQLCQVVWALGAFCMLQSEIWSCARLARERYQPQATRTRSGCTMMGINQPLYILAIQTNTLCWWLRAISGNNPRSWYIVNFFPISFGLACDWYGPWGTRTAIVCTMFAIKQPWDIIDTQNKQLCLWLSEIGGNGQSGWCFFVQFFPPYWYDP